MTENRPQQSWGSEFFEGLPIQEYLRIARRRKWWIILTTLAMFVATVVVVMRLPNIYRSETVILVDPRKVPDSFVPSTVTLSVTDRLSTIRQQVMSPTRLKRIIDSMGLYSELRGKRTEQEIIGIMQSATTIVVLPNPRPGDRLSAFQVAFSGRNPVKVAEVANELAGLFIEENLKVREQQAYGTAEFLDTELQVTRKQLEEKEAELRTIKSRYIMDLPESRQFHLQSLVDLRSQIRTSEERVHRAQQQSIYLQSLLASIAPTVDLDVGGNNPTTSPLQSQIQKLESELATLRQRYGPRHPDIRKRQSELDKLKATAPPEENAEAPVPVSPTPARAIRNPVLQAQLQQLDEEIREQLKLQEELQKKTKFHLSKLERIPIFEQRIMGLMRDYQTLQDHYRTMLNRKLGADMASSLESYQKGERFIILDAAVIPEKPYKPNRPLLSLAGLLGGLMGGVGLAAMVEMTDESVRNEKEAAKILGALVLGGIPRILTPRQRRRRRLNALAAATGTVLGSAALAFLLNYLKGTIF